MLEEYQDLWISGECVQKGARECAARYEVIKRFCSQYERPFTVLDLGAHRGYFSVRLAEDFDCTVVAVEHDKGLTEEALKPNANPRVIHLCRRISVEDLEALARCEHFDVVLALSFIHHQGVPFRQYVERLMALGDHLIVEAALESTASGIPAAKGVRDDLYDGEILAEHPAHFGTCGPRPMVHWHRPKTVIAKPFIGCMDLPGGDYPVVSDFKTKTINGREFFRGINLRTYDELGGIYPDKAWISSRLEARGMPAGHGDIGPHNVILQGDDAVLIDGEDPRPAMVDDRCWNRLVRQRDWGVWS